MLEKRSINKYCQKRKYKTQERIGGASRTIISFRGGGKEIRKVKCEDNWGKSI